MFVFHAALKMQIYAFVAYLRFPRELLPRPPLKVWDLLSFNSSRDLDPDLIMISAPVQTSTLAGTVRRPAGRPRAYALYIYLLTYILAKNYAICLVRTVLQLLAFDAPFGRARRAPSELGP